MIWCCTILSNCTYQNCMTVTVIYCVITWISYNCQVHIVLYLWTTEKSQPHLKTNKNDIQHAIIHHKDKKIFGWTYVWTLLTTRFEEFFALSTMIMMDSFENCNNSQKLQFQDFGINRTFVCKQWGMIEYWLEIPT